jgi:hypothetical protein
VAVGSVAIFGLGSMVIKQLKGQYQLGCKVFGSRAANTLSRHPSWWWKKAEKKSSLFAPSSWYLVQGCGHTRLSETLRQGSDSLRALCIATKRTRKSKRLSWKVSMEVEGNQAILKATKA